MEILTVEFIAQIGFPIAVTIYLLIERTKFNEKIVEQMTKISETLERLEIAHR